MFALYNEFTARIYSVGGEVQVFDTLESADTFPNIGYKAMPLSEAITSMRVRLVELEGDATYKFNSLKHHVETYLKDGIEGALDPDEFMAETEALAEAVGFEFTEEKTYIVEVAVMVKQKRGADIDSYAFTAEMYVNDDDVEITGVDINSIDEQ